MFTAFHTVARRATLRESRSYLTKQGGRWLSAVVSDMPLPEEDAPVTASATKPDEDSLERYLRPSEIVKKLDDYVVGQEDAKRAVAVALRNRWRRRMLPDDIKKEIMPKNVLLVGPTGKRYLSFNFVCR